MLRLFLALTLLTLASCGADGDPLVPGTDKTSSGVTVSGEARMGVTGSF